MKLYVGVTDNEWFEFVRKLEPDEVNFWRPRSTTNFRALEPGGIFLFKLHSPHDFVAGGGIFSGFSTLPLKLAWDAFGEKNGAADFQSFARLILKHRRESEPNPMIGCILLSEPFFLSEEEWIPIPSNWSKNIVAGKGYDTAEEHGAWIWDQLQDRLTRDRPQAHVLREGSMNYGTGKVLEGREYLARARLGQGAFRILVTDTYSRRCSITGERTLPVLEAAHIKPYAEAGPNLIQNGLCMRSDLHILFDRGYLTVTDDYRVEVSPRIREEYENGREYYAHHGKELAVVPEQEVLKPSKEFIQWHNENIYVA